MDMIKYQYDSKFLQIIFQNSYNTSDLPQDWLTADVIPIFKKGKKNLASNYRPVSLTAITCKLIEHTRHTHIIQHCDSQNILQNCQHGFRKKTLMRISNHYHHRKITTQHRPEETSRCYHFGLFKSFRHRGAQQINLKIMEFKVKPISG